MWKEKLFLDFCFFKGIVSVELTLFVSFFGGLSLGKERSLIIYIICIIFV